MAAAIVYSPGELEEKEKVLDSWRRDDCCNDANSKGKSKIWVIN